MASFTCLTAPRSRHVLRLGVVRDLVATRPSGLVTPPFAPGDFDHDAYTKGPHTFPLISAPMEATRPVLHGHQAQSTRAVPIAPMPLSHSRVYAGSGSAVHRLSVARRLSTVRGMSAHQCMWNGPQREMATVRAGTTDEDSDVFAPRDYTDVEANTDVVPPGPGDGDTRPLTYTLIGAAGVVGAMAAKSTVMDLVGTWSASSEALALAQVEVDLSAIPAGKSVVIKWRGKPVFIRHRTSDEIATAGAVPLSELRDPQSDAERAARPEWVVMLGICTHLGCVPVSDSGDYGGWYCPCHGSHYDVAGRIRKGPAPTNLEIPEHQFVSDDQLVIG